MPIRFFPCRLLASVLFITTIMLASQRVEAVELTPMQREYLQAHGKVTMCVDPDWEPYEQITHQGQYVGIAADLIRLIAQRVGVELELIPAKDWDESIEFSKSGKCDVLAFLNRTSQRDEWLVFTEPYFSDPNVFITREEHDYIANPEALSGATIALPSGTSIEERIRRDYPNLTVLGVESEAEALRLVEERKADMTLRSLTMAAYTIKQEGWFNLKISGEIPSYTNQLRIGVIKEKPLLRDVLDAGVKTITPQEVREIVNRHVSIKVASRVDYALVFKIAGGGLALLAISLMWILMLRRLNRKLVILSDKLRVELTARKQAEEHLRLVLDTAPTYIFAKDADGRFLLANKALADVVGLTPDELLGKRAEILGASPELVAAYLHDDMTVISEGRELIIPEERIPRKDGSLGWFQVTKTPYRLPGLDAQAVLGVAVDITERKAFEEQLQRMASIDALTEVNNRRSFMDKAEKEFSRSQRYKSPLSVVMFDVDYFKNVNDSYGHGVGDKVLVMLAAKANDILREVDVLGRLGGEEFAVLLPETNVSRALQVAERLRAEAENMDVSFAQGLELTISLGVAQLNETTTSIDELLKHADSAMYQAKHTGRNRVVGYEAGMV